MIYKDSKQVYSHIMKTQTTSTPCTAYPYLRFSKSEQVEGDSIRRQNDAFDRWLKANPQAVVNDRFGMRDEGVSAFEGNNFAEGALGKFLVTARQRRLGKHPHLLLEDLDRFSRAKTRVAYRFFDELLELGVAIVDLSDGKVHTNDNFDLIASFGVQMKMERAHGESERKSLLCRKAWDGIKQKARNEGKPIGRSCPGWLEFDGKDYQPRQPQWSIMQQIVEDILDGITIPTLVRKLNTTTPLVTLKQKSQGWTAPTLYKILRGRTLRGEYQPCIRRKKKHIPDGEPIKLYPELVTENKWLQVQSKLMSRKRSAGATGGRGSRAVPNLFGRLLVSGSDGTVMHLAQHCRRGRALISLATKLGKADGGCFNYADFETSFLQWVREVKLEQSDQVADKVTEVTGALSVVSKKLGEIEADLDAHGLSDLLSRKLRQYESEKSELEIQLATLRAQQASPTVSVKDIQLSPTSPEDRERTRSAIQQVVKRITIWISGNTNVRTAEVAVEFHNGKIRLFGIRKRKGLSIITAGFPIAFRCDQPLNRPPITNHRRLMVKMLDTVETHARQSTFKRFKPSTTPATPAATTPLAEPVKGKGTYFFPEENKPATAIKSQKRAGGR